VYFTQPGVEQSPADNPCIALVGYIDATRHTLDVAAYELDEPEITNALLRAASRGVKVRVVTDSDYVREHGPTVLRQAGVPIVDDRRGALMHNKFMVFDQTAVWTGSMNFTVNCTRKNDNHGVYLPIPDVARNYTAKFGWMFEKRSFGTRPSRTDLIPHPEITLTDGGVVETYFAPHDRCADAVTREVRKAKEGIDFLLFSFTHTKIGGAMAEKNATGVSVRGVFEKTQTAGGYSQFQKLRNLGLQVYTDVNPRNMHHKLMIIDTETVLFGSFNYSDNADTSNDENLVILRRVPEIVREFEWEFERVYRPAAAR
jgi:phosphatidylserine/phosphatidylglycerophosphate/cardiolipin synthase-like enzyme